MRTETVGIREAKAHFSRYLKNVAQGMEIILTDRGVPVGRIVPILPDHVPLDLRLKKLEEKGIIGRESGHRPAMLSLPIAVPNGIAQRFLEEDRANG